MVEAIIAYEALCDAIREGDPEMQRSAYIAFGTEEIAREVTRLAYIDEVGNGQSVIRFLLDHRLRDDPERTPMKLRNINYRKLLAELRTRDDIRFGEGVKVYIPTCVRKTCKDGNNLTESKSIGKI